MNIFVTGATGWIGSALVTELLDAGHAVTGLARDAAKGDALAASGAAVVRGTLDDVETLRRAAEAADGIAHLAFNHDFSRFAENAEQDRRTIELLGDVVGGSERPLLVTSGVALVAPGRVATEQDVPPSVGFVPRQSETAARALRDRGVRATTIRLAPSVHGEGERHGFVPILIGMAREKGVSAYLGAGANRWPGVHRQDAARLYRLVLEGGASDAVYHATAEEGVPFARIAETIGRHLGVPVEPRDREHFGWFADFAGADIPASSSWTRERLGWQPVEPGLLADIDDDSYYGS